MNDLSDPGNLLPRLREIVGERGMVAREGRHPRGEIAGRADLPFENGSRHVRLQISSLPARYAFSATTTRLRPPCFAA